MSVVSSPGVHRCHSPPVVPFEFLDPVRTSAYLGLHRLPYFRSPYLRPQRRALLIQAIGSAWANSARAPDKLPIKKTESTLHAPTPTEDLQFMHAAMRRCVAPISDCSQHNPLPSLLIFTRGHGFQLIHSVHAGPHPLLSAEHCASQDLRRCRGPFPLECIAWRVDVVTPEAAMPGQR